MFNKKVYQETFSQVKASQETHRRICNMYQTEKKTHRRMLPRAMILAAVIALLAVTASAAGWNWFVRFFGGETKLNPDQLQYLEENTQIIPTQTDIQKEKGEYAVTLDSILTDGQVCYFTLKMTLPEFIESPGEGWSMEEHIHFSDLWMYPADQEKATMEDIIQWTSGIRAVDDGDGLDSTWTLVLSMRSNSPEDPFAQNQSWKLHLSGIEAVWHNRENERYLYDVKYAGQDVMLVPEESEMVTRYEVLCEGTWEFAVTIGDGEQQAVELAAAPVELTGYRHATIAEILRDPEVDSYGPYAIRLVSLKISPLSYYIEFDSSSQAIVPDDFTLVLKDGTEIKMHPYSGRHYFSQPMVLTEIDHVLLPDGTKLMMPS